VFGRVLACFLRVVLPPKHAFERLKAEGETKDRPEPGLPALTFHFYSHQASLAQLEKTIKPTGVFLGGFVWRSFIGISS
jgi:hypothetical protein